MKTSSRSKLVEKSEQLKEGTPLIIEFTLFSSEKSRGEKFRINSYLARRVFPPTFPVDWAIRKRFTGQHLDPQLVASFHSYLVVACAQVKLTEFLPGRLLSYASQVAIWKPINLPYTTTIHLNYQHHEWPRPAVYASFLLILVSTC